MDDKLAGVIAEILRPQIVETVREVLREQLANPAGHAITVYNVDQVADLLHTSREQVMSYIRSKRLKSFKLERDSRKNLIHSDDLAALIDWLKAEAS